MQNPPRTKGSRQATVTMTVTAYCPCGKCCGYERGIWGIPIYTSGPLKGKVKHVGITADGTKAVKGTIAADISIYPYGTYMYVPGYGWGVVHDVGGDIKGNHIDVFFPKHQQAVDWGRKRLQVKVIWE
jgi:3D (Asp-Asp-Asp) domain-containing protein